MAATENKKVYKPKSFYLDEIPEDVYDIMIDEQARLKKECRCQKNLQQTIYSLIRRAVKK